MHTPDPDPYARRPRSRPAVRSRLNRSNLVSLGVVLLLGIVPVLVPLLVIRGGSPVTAEPARPPQPAVPPGPTAPTATTPPPRPTPPPAPSTRGSTGTPTGAPDLTVLSVALSPTRPSTGDHITLSAVIENRGTAPTPRGTVLGVAFLVDGVTVTWSDTDDDPLPPGAHRTYTATAGLTGNTWTATPGGHEFTARADDRDRIQEPNESDNTRTITRAVLHR